MAAISDNRSGAGIFNTPLSSSVVKRPDDMVLEVIRELFTGVTTADFTMLTDTSLLGYATGCIPVSVDNDPGEVSVSALGKVVTVKIESVSEKHNLHIFGGYGAQQPEPNGFVLQRASGPTQGLASIYWEIHFGTLSGDGTAVVTAATHLDKIDFPQFVIPTQVIVNAVPDADGVAVNTLTSVDFTLECGGGALLVAYLVGGFELGETPTSIDLEDMEMWQDLSIHLPSIKTRQPGDLLGEFITKTLSDDSEFSTSFALITAADDCNYIRHIEMVIPISKNTTPEAIGWEGTTGLTTKIRGQDGATSKVQCLVLGY